MKIKKLFKIPVSSLELSNKIEMEIKGLDITLILKYFDEKNKVLKLCDVIWVLLKSLQRRCLMLMILLLRLKIQNGLMN